MARTLHDREDYSIRPRASMTDFSIVALIAGAAAAASLAGGVVALWHKPTTLFMSAALGFASGSLLATIGFEMLPQARALGSLTTAVVGFVLGFALVYGFDLYIHYGQLAGEASEQRRKVEAFYQGRRPRGDEVTVLAGGTSAEELIEGLTIGVAASIAPGTALLVALAIAIDNLGEGLSIGALIQRKHAGKGSARARILGWTSLVGAAVFVSSIAGWLALRRLSEPIIGFLFAVGAGAMFYLTITQLVPEAEEHHYQQSAAISMAVGFIAIFALSRWI
ncbi:MAG: ZIP family metal transporter [Gemmatimonadota bacterium]